MRDLKSPKSRVAVPHPRWGERPLLIVAPRPGRKPDCDGLIGFLGQQFPRRMLMGKARLPSGDPADGPLTIL
jgi:hypothetical protein